MFQKVRKYLKVIGSISEKLRCIENNQVFQKIRKHLKVIGSISKIVRCIENKISLRKSKQVS